VHTRSRLEFPGDSGVLPWIGRKTGREAISDFVRDTQTMVESVSVDIKEVLASDDLAVISGHLQLRINATGKLIDRAFAIVLTFSGAKIASIPNAGRQPRRVGGRRSFRKIRLTI
jgi:uncharacterized protein